jgi:hypothetical protein
LCPWRFDRCADFATSRSGVPDASLSLGYLGFDVVQTRTNTPNIVENTSERDRIRGAKIDAPKSFHQLCWIDDFHGVKCTERGVTK